MSAFGKILSKETISAMLADAGLAFLGGTLGFIILIGIAASVFWIVEIVDILRRRFNGSEKVVWLLVVFFLHFVGALIYKFVGQKNGVID
jgi:hypothetical protein